MIRMQGLRLLCLAAVLAGCAAPADRRDAALPPVEDRAGGPARGGPLAPEAPAGEGGRAPAPATKPPAVVALTERAEGAMAAGDWIRAAFLLERALRIAPEDPWLWYRLARVRLHQGARDEAIELARKSLSLSGGDARLEALVRRLIRSAGGRLLE